ncbi:YolD-like family protein [Peribacillus sp. NPDC055009]
MDEFQLEEFDQRICLAMEYNFAVEITKWADGFNYEIVGGIHYVDPIHKEVRLKTEADEVERIKDGRHNCRGSYRINSADISVFLPIIYRCENEGRV